MSLSVARSHVNLDTIKNLATARDEEVPAMGMPASGFISV
jgi:hypothetical protein